MQKEFTQQAQNVLGLAKNLAKKLNHPYVGTEHMLLALTLEVTGVASHILAMNGVTEENVATLIDELLVPGEVRKYRRIEYSPRLDLLLNNAAKESEIYDSEKIGTEHLLLGMMRDTESVATKILGTLNVNLEKVQIEIIGVVCMNPQEFYEENIQESSSGKKEMLERFATDLTEQAANGKLDPVIGRQEEIERLMQVLSRRTKNNPCLIGEPGVGKTAIIEGLASRIAEGLVPNSMKDKRILTLDLSGMVAGSKYRGEFEERMKKLLREVKMDRSIILFLDEIHTIIGAGGAEGALNAANIMKPSMARGEIQLIGATTITEYRKNIEKDAALERRFQPIMVEEPGNELCREILEGLKHKYEEHHNVMIGENAIVSAIQLSERYIHDRRLPDKAIDVLDEACSRVSLRGFKVPEKLDEFEKQLSELIYNKEEQIKAGNFAEASLLNQEQVALEKKIDNAKKRYQKSQEKQRLTITEEDVAAVVSSWTKIPVQKLSETESAKLKKLEQTLHKRVIGQDEAVSVVVKSIKRGRVGVKSPNRPVGSFLFLGPTGVGKTELAKALAEALFGKDESVIRVDMSEYMEKHSVSKIIGSPPGYVGHEEGGQLSEKVRRNPYSVVLFDEIEKAHPDVFNILLQVLDDGHITDSQGRKVDFRNTVIIMTSNAGAKAIIEPKKLGFGAKEDGAEDYKKMKSNVMEEVKKIFRPEFLNRIDDTIVFHSLDEEHMKKIVGLMCKELAKRVRNQLGIKLNIRDSAKKYIVEKGTDKKYGARPLRRALQNELEDKLAEAILEGNVAAGAEVDVSSSKEGIIFTTRIE